jgi:hypothetical protein
VAQARLHGLPVAIAARPAELDAPTVARLRAFAVDDVHVTLWPGRGAEGPPLASELRAAADAYRRCVAAGQRAALALPLTRGVADALDAVLDVAELNGVARLVFTRRHARSVRTPPGAPLGLLESRAAVATLIARARRWGARGRGRSCRSPATSPPGRTRCCCSPTTTRTPRRERWRSWSAAPRARRRR